MEDLNYEETTKSLDELLRSIQRGYGSGLLSGT